MIENTNSSLLKIICFVFVFFQNLKNIKQNLTQTKVIINRYKKEKKKNKMLLKLTQNLTSRNY